MFSLVSVSAGTIPSRHAATRIVGSFAPWIRSRERLYVAGFNAELTLLRREHGRGPVREALQRLEASTRYEPKECWDAEGHARVVKRSIAQIL